MEKINKEELNKLKPEERIKKLRELQRKNVKEFQEAKRLIAETEGQISREEIAERVKVPESREVDITKLFDEVPVNVSLAEIAREEVTQQNERYITEISYEVAKNALEKFYEGEKIDLGAVDAVGEKLQKVKYTTANEDIAVLAIATLQVFYKLKKEQHEL